MKNIKIWFQAFLLITVVWFSSMGCVTKQLWDQKRADYSYGSYSDTIISFYINRQSSQIAFLGENYHYIFDNPNQDFIQLIEAKNFLNLRENNLEITSRTSKDNPTVHTDIRISFKEGSVNSRQISWLKNHQFRTMMVPPLVIEHQMAREQNIKYPNRIDPRTIKPRVDSYRKVFQLEGKRYIANSQVNSRVQKLNQPLRLSINEVTKENEPSKLGEALKVPFKIVATPFTLVADALLMAGFIFVPFK
jgi:hypothetical protein